MEIAANSAEEEVLRPEAGASQHKNSQRRHGGGPEDRFPFDGVRAPTLRKQLRELRLTILERALPWAQTMSPRRAYDEIRQFGEGAWIVRIWLGDYSDRLSK